MRRRDLIQVLSFKRELNKSATGFQALSSCVVSPQNMEYVSNTTYVHYLSHSAGSSSPARRYAQ